MSFKSRINEVIFIALSLDRCGFDRPDDIDSDMSLVHDLDADIISICDIAADLDKEFNMSIPDSVVIKWIHVSDIYEYFYHLPAAKQAQLSDKDYEENLLEHGIVR